MNEESPFHIFSSLSKSKKEKEKKLKKEPNMQSSSPFSPNYRWKPYDRKKLFDPSRSSEELELEEQLEEVKKMQEDLKNKLEELRKHPQFNLSREKEKEIEEIIESRKQVLMGKIAATLGGASLLNPTEISPKEQKSHRKKTLGSRKNWTSL